MVFTNNCNLNCSFCIGNKRDKKFIAVEQFKVLLDKLEGFTKYLYFHVEEDEFENLSEDIDADRDMQEFNTQNFYNRQHYCGNRLVPHDKKCNGKGT